MEPNQVLEVWREVGADQLAPGRFRCIEALAQRTAGQRGAIREHLDKRLEDLIDAYASDLDQAALKTAEADGAEAGSEARSEGLAGLIGALPFPAGYPELSILEELRETIAGLRAEDQLKRSLQSAPRNAGPINSHSLVHQALSLMQSISPEYLRKFLDQIDTFSWLDQLRPALGPGPSTVEGAARSNQPRKTPRNRR
jgi:hypothetical protein